ncbi:MAG: hypothetical protein Q9162_007781 [Coniocarpon cinnabarinum]
MNTRSQSQAAQSSGTASGPTPQESAPDERRLDAQSNNNNNDADNESHPQSQQESAANTPRSNNDSEESLEIQLRKAKKELMKEKLARLQEKVNQYEARDQSASNQTAGRKHRRNTSTDENLTFLLRKDPPQLDRPYMGAFDRWVSEVEQRLEMYRIEDWEIAQVALWATSGLKYELSDK